MKVRWIAALAALSVTFAGLTIGAALRYLVSQIEALSPSGFQTSDPSELESFIRWVNSGFPFYQAVPWLAMSALLTGLVALALAARRAQLRRGAHG